jgi:hypothetical protein
MEFPPGLLEASFPGSSGAIFTSSGSGLSAGAIFALFGLLVAVILGSALFLVFAKRADIADLRKNGNRILATVQGVEHKTRSYVSGTGSNEMVNTRHYYVVLAAWTDPETGLSHTFASDEFVSRPGCSVGDSVPVLVDPSDSTHYHVEM